MKIPKLHSWALTYEEASALQRDLRGQLLAKSLPKNLETVAGADVSYSRGSDVLYGAVVVIEMETLNVIEEVTTVATATFPYVPGYLSFREGPIVIDCFRKLRHTPDAVIFDGQGIAHPRRFGLAAHIGVWLDLPTVGCAKTRLIGNYKEPGNKRGARQQLTHGTEVLGSVVRTRDNVKPVFVSPGQYLTVDAAVDLVLMCGAGRRLPEPTRLAHLAVNRARLKALTGGN